MLDLNKDVKYIKGVGPNRVVLLNHLGIFTLQELITYFPRTYEDRSKPKEIYQCVDGEEVLIEATVVTRMTEIRLKRNTMYRLIVRDETATCTITWFNQSYLKNIFKKGQKYKFFGKISNKAGRFEMTSPVFDSERKRKQYRKNNSNLSTYI